VDALVQPEKARSTLKTYLDILVTVRDEGRAKPTRILQRANLAYDRLNKHLQELVSKQLLEEKQEDDSRYYVITPKGLEFIDNVRKAEAFVKGFGISL
jgi:predicted transcriptional regulator